MSSCGQDDLSSCSKVMQSVELVRLVRGHAGSSLTIKFAYIISGESRRVSVIPQRSPTKFNACGLDQTAAIACIIMAVPHFDPVILAQPEILA